MTRITRISFAIREIREIRGLKLHWVAACPRCELPGLGTRPWLVFSLHSVGVPGIYRLAKNETAWISRTLWQ